MLRSFVIWLDSYIAQRGASAVIAGLVGIMAFAGLLGTVFGSQVVRAGGFTAVGLLIVTGILLMLADRRRLQREYDIHRDLLTKYCDFITDHRPEPLILVSDWSQDVHLKRNGDVRELITIKATVLREDIHFLRFKAGCEWNQPERYRNKVKIRARSLKVNGSAGPHWNVTRSWPSDRKMRVLVHLHSPVRQGQEIRLEMERLWPAKCKPLMCDSTVDNFVFSTTKLIQIQKVCYRVILPKGFSAVYWPLGFDEEETAECGIEEETDRDGRKNYILKVRDLTSYAEVGMQLELE